MASQPYPDKRRHTWIMKYRPVPEKGWVTVVLGKDPRLAGARPPAKPPQFVIDRAREFAEIEYRASHGLGSGPARAVGLASYAAGYLEAHGKVSRKGSTKLLKRFIERFVGFCETKGATTLQGVTREICRSFLVWRLEDIKPSTLRTERGLLIGIWSRAVEDELIPFNPWTAAKIPKRIAETTIQFWTSEEIGRIVAACKREPYQDLVLLLANSGLRASSALAMEFSWINWRENTIELPEGEDIKTAYTHVMGRVVRDVLERRKMLGGEGLVFPNTVNPGRIPYDTARDNIMQAIADAGVPKGTLHDFRHSYGRALALARVPVTVIQSQLGHTNLTMTMRYTKTNEDHAAKAIGDWGVGESIVPPP